MAPGVPVPGIRLFENPDPGAAVHDLADIAGVMDSDADDGIFSKGSTGYGVRLFADLLGSYAPPR